MKKPAKHITFERQKPPARPWTIPIPNDTYRKNYDAIFKKGKKSDSGNRSR